ncbi:hypothetical protein [Rhodoferax sp. GW822-FHT02A01]|uniref:hypothetical protein n=1 Tax=Rhodoferax sp. GW822-FHT02A01 TaxID=3141537 RepID=UPI00315C5D24
MASLAWLLLAHVASDLRDLKLQRTALETKIKAASSVTPIPLKPAFADTLPSLNRTDDVVRDIGRSAQEAGVQITALGIEPRAATPTQIGAVIFNVAATASYKASKDWLSQLLGRYHSLAVNTLSLQAMPTDPSRQDVHVTLVWYVKD